MENLSEVAKRMPEKREMEKNVTFSFDKSSEAEEMTNRNFTFHIDVPISDNEVVRCVASSKYSYLHSQFLDAKHLYW